MPIPSAEIIQVLDTFTPPAFTKPTFPNALLLVYGTLLALGTRTVTAALRALGLAHRPDFTTYQRVLNRARCSPLVVSRLLLGLLLRTLVPADAPLVVDETLERRRGAKIAYKSFFRDPVRWTSNNPVNSEGIRWLCMALLVEVPWSEKRQWALPFLTVPVLWLRRPARSWANPIARWSIGHSYWCGWLGTGNRIERWSWWATGATPPCASGTPAGACRAAGGAGTAPRPAASGRHLARASGAAARGQARAEAQERATPAELAGAARGA